ncbi:MAG: GNAT family N-acetyltransferase [Halalkalicoccus sp.]|nr:GNAT family N-acetyltransferase [Halalkalicoccus sp.]
MALTERCFGSDPGGLEARMPHCFDDEHPARHAIVKVDGKVVSHVVCVPAELWAGDARVDCHGIAGVATDPAHRGNGYMHQLLEFWLNRLDDRDVPIAELEGDRVRYGRYGWENAGREELYRITRRSFTAGRGASEDGANAIRRYRGAADIETIQDVHGTERYRVSRDRRRYERLLEQTGLETLVFDGSQSAYLCYRGEDPASVLEFGGSREGVAALLECALDATGEIAVYTHPHHPLTDLFRELAAGWECHPHRKLNVLDFPATIDAYRPLFEERWARTVDAFGSVADAVTLGMTSSSDRLADDTADTPTQSVTVAYDASGVSVERTDREPDVTFDRRGAVGFLFGSRDSCRSLKRIDPFLDAVLPLEYYFWQTETI